MNEKTREEMILAIEKAVQAVGAENYEEGMEKARKFIAFLNASLQSMQTIDALRSTLNSMAPSTKREEAIMLLLMRQLPQVIRMGLKLAAHKATSTLPSPPGGRPRRFTARESLGVVNYITQLLGKGSSLDAAKARASQKFDCGLRTIERVWAGRASIPENDPTIDDALQLIARGE